MVINNSPWTESDINSLLYLRKKGSSFSQISKELNRTPDACRNKYRSLKSRQAETVNENIKNDAQPNIAVDAVEEAIKKVNKSFNQIKFYEFLPETNHQRKEQDLVLVLSDIHWGSKYSLTETGGISQYDTQIADQRLTNLMYGVKEIFEIHSYTHKINKLHIFCLGDVVAGDRTSGKWNPNYIDTPVAHQIIESSAKIVEMIVYWLQFIPEIEFTGLYGNHGRIGKPNAEKINNNYDYLCYKFIEASFRDNKRICFDIPESWFRKKEIRGWNFTLVHGEDVSGENIFKNIKDFELSIMGMTKSLSDYTIAAHFHNSTEFSTNQGKILLNGSVMGGDVYSIKNCYKNSKPEQILFGVNDSRGITYKYNIDLEDEKRKVS